MRNESVLIDNQNKHLDIVLPENDTTHFIETRITAALTLSRLFINLPFWQQRPFLCLRRLQKLSQSLTFLSNHTSVPLETCTHISSSKARVDSLLTVVGGEAKSKATKNCYTGIPDWQPGVTTRCVCVSRWDFLIRKDAHILCCVSKKSKCISLWWMYETDSAQLWQQSRESQLNQSLGKIFARRSSDKTHIWFVVSCKVCWV